MAELQRLIKEEKARERAELLAKIRPTDVYSLCGIAPEFWKASVEQFDKEQVDKALTALGKGKYRVLYLCGEAGRGKTHFASALCREFIHKDLLDAERRVHFTSLSRILLAVRSSYDRRTSEEEILDGYLGYKLLVLDDIGRERSSDFSRWILFFLADGRKSWRKATIYITDKPYPVMLTALFNQEIMSRIYQNVVHFKGADRRQLDIRRMEIGG